MHGKMSITGLPSNFDISQMARTNRLPPLESETRSMKGGSVSYRSHSHAQMQQALEDEKRAMAMAQQR